jgi:electron transport complex protein RnfE
MPDKKIKFPESQTAERAKMKSIFLDGLLLKNPILVLMLGMCSALAVSTTLINAIGMGVSTTFVLICSNVVISLIRKKIPSQIRIVSYVVIIAGFVTMIDLLLQAFAPGLSRALGIYIPLIVVNCIILARAETFASQQSPGLAALDGVSMGLGYTMALCAMGIIREVLGSGKLLGHSLFGAGFQPVMYIAMPCGGFFTLGCLIALTQYLKNRLGGKKA